MKGDDCMEITQILLTILIAVLAIVAGFRAGRMQGRIETEAMYDNWGKDHKIERKY